MDIKFIFWFDQVSTLGELKPFGMISNPHQVEFADLETLTKIVCTIKPEWVFHLAAHGAYSWQNDLHRIVQTNILGTINLVEACLKTGFEVFVNTGSSSEYGFKPYAPSEQEWLEPNSYYAVAKASATLFCGYTAQNYKVRIPTLRLYSVYGPYEAPGRLIPTLILHGFKEQLPPLVNPDITRDYIYIEDVIEAYLLTATAQNQALGTVYNVGTGIQTSLCEIVNITQHILNFKAEPKWGSMTERRWDTNIWVSDNRTIRQALNWQPNYLFERGFQATVNWFRDNPTLWQFYEEPAKHWIRASACDDQFHCLE